MGTLMLFAAVNVLCVMSCQWSPLMTAGCRTGTSGEQPLGFTTQCCVAVNQNSNFVCVCFGEDSLLFMSLVCVCVDKYRFVCRRIFLQSKRFSLSLCCLLRNSEAAGMKLWLLPKFSDQIYQISRTVRDTVKVLKILYITISTHSASQRSEIYLGRRPPSASLFQSH